MRISVIALLTVMAAVVSSAPAPNETTDSGVARPTGPPPAPGWFTPFKKFSKPAEEIEDIFLLLQSSIVGVEFIEMHEPQADTAGLFLSR
ncbi:hypothetical protein FRC04_004124 [Tulasnella sp. 424]|nr:hypothetical protein FRC04_004124 [Tulasnella sp. 424]